MNFGKWIVVAFVLFAGFIATLVTVCVRQDISLVSKDYYKDELVYQDQIVRIQNTRQLDRAPAIKVKEKMLQVEFGQFSEIEKGEVKLFCPSNAHNDKHFTLRTSTEPVQLFELNTLQPGMYKAKMLWTMNGEEFYYEEIINI
jgi:hypothetical protein